MKPPLCNTGAEITGDLQVNVHWYTGTLLPDGDSGVSVESVLGFLAETLGESVVILDHGRRRYSQGYEVGPVQVYWNPDLERQGVLVQVTGEGCEELGLSKIAAIHSGLGLRSSRLDIAADTDAFTPRALRDEVRLGNVRTRVKVPESAAETRQWRRHTWIEGCDGDTFTLGSRSSEQYVRCYDSRGQTRFELELKGRTAAAAADALLGLVTKGQGNLFAVEALGWVRRFVDFVDATSDANVSRQTLLPFWESFISGADRAQVQFEGVVVKTVEVVRDWVVRQVAPALALLQQALGSDELLGIAEKGLTRMKGRHWNALRAYRPGGSAVGIV